MKLALYTDPARRRAEQKRTASQALIEALGSEHELLWTAAGPEDLLRRCAAQRPNLLLLPLHVPAEVTLIRQLMATTPCPILLITLDEPPPTSLVFEAMGHGALDVVHLPGWHSAATAQINLLRRKIHNIGWLAKPGGRENPPTHEINNGQRAGMLVAIGASAGGPASLSTLLRGLPVDFDAAVVLVQHIDDKFSPGLAEWLGRESRLPVRLVQDGETPQAGLVLLCGRNDHLRWQNGALVYDDTPDAHVHRPSIDVFFDSVARNWPSRAIGVLLTGMGRDGAQGLKRMRERGFMTIAQDQASSAVYGMPKAAVELGAAQSVLPLDEIAPRLAALCKP